MDDCGAILHNIETKWLYDFLTLEKCRNFSQAAVSRNVSQPAFSRRIRALEQAIGVELFNRQVTPLQLSEQGKIFHSQIRHLLQQLETHIMRLLISLWDVGTVFFTIYPQVFRHEKSSIYYKYIEPLSYCFSISFKILIITVYGFMKWYICKCLFCKVYLLDLSYNRNAKPMTGSNELRFNLTQIRG